MLWNEECVNKTMSTRHPKFSMWYMQGKVVLPPTKIPLKLLEKLVTMRNSRSSHLMKEIRNYNNMFAFTSMGGKIDHSVNRASEVAALIVGDFDIEKGERDIIVEHRSKKMQCIDELHPLYLTMQYPLLFAYGDDGYREETLFRDGLISDNRKKQAWTLTCAYSIIVGPNDKFSSVSQIDSVIFSKIPNPHAHSELYEAVKNFMIYGPYGASRTSSPCMVNDKCSKHFHKRFCDKTSFNDDGYTKYRRWPTLISCSVTNHDRSSTCSNMLVKDKTKLRQQYSIKHLLKVMSVKIRSSNIMIVDQQGIVFADDNIDDVVSDALLKQTKFLACLEANRIYDAARELTYAQFLIKFVFKHNLGEWYPRKVGYEIGRFYYVPPGLDDDKEYIDGITEASKWSSDLQFDDKRLKEIALADIERILRSNGRSLRDYPLMPLPNDAMMSNTENVLMSEELNYDRTLLSTQHSQLLSSLIAEQRNIYDSIMDVVYCCQGGVFFVNGFGGSSKTFLWNTLTSTVHSHGDIVLADVYTTEFLIAISRSGLLYHELAVTRLFKHVVEATIKSGIAKLEWAVRPPGKSKEAIPLKANVKTISPLERKAVEKDIIMEGHSDSSSTATSSKINHIWSSAEDELLVQSMLSLMENLKFYENGTFNGKYLGKLEEMMELNALGCGLKATPHIQGRIRTLKANWQIVYDMVNHIRASTSGFGWDNDRKCVVTDEHSWEEYLKLSCSHSRAGPYKHKSFPHFDALTIMYGKDRATGSAAISPQQARNNARAQPFEPNTGEEMDYSEGPTIDRGTEASSGSRETKRCSGNKEELKEVVREMTDRMGKMFTSATRELVSSIASAKNMQADVVAEAVMFINGLSVEELQVAHLKIASNPILWRMFNDMPEEKKTDWVRQHIL
ncbi:uncharacterized protein G2W53_008178 [Senna tora]|uniref:ATP-dependent DNA helicase n=1 Tax=Senna tora TaxID=362788 RepID=A0A835CEE9_9FABA|nr:uncharacterized protein G2W53_008178 [Senna tora]